LAGLHPRPAEVPVGALDAQRLLAAIATHHQFVLLTNAHASDRVAQRLRIAYVVAVRARDHIAGAHASTSGGRARQHHLHDDTTVLRLHGDAEQRTAHRLGRTRHVPLWPGPTVEPAVESAIEASAGSMVAAAVAALSIAAVVVAEPARDGQHCSDGDQHSRQPHKDRHEVTSKRWHQRAPVLVRRGGQWGGRSQAL
jgi:hypothetical protein